MPIPLPFLLGAGLAVGIGAAIVANQDEIRAFFQKHNIRVRLPNGEYSEHHERFNDHEQEDHVDSYKSHLVMDAQDLQFIYAYLELGATLPPHISAEVVRNRYIVIDKQLHRNDGTHLENIDYLRFSSSEPPRYENEFPMKNLGNLRHRRHTGRSIRSNQTGDFSINQMPGNSKVILTSGTTSSAATKATDLSSTPRHPDTYVIDSATEDSELTPADPLSPANASRYGSRRNSVASDTFSAYQRRTVRQYYGAGASDTCSIAGSEYALQSLDTNQHSTDFSWVDGAPSLSADTGYDTPSVAGSVETDFETEEENEPPHRRTIIVNESGPN